MERLGFLRPQDFTGRKMTRLQIDRPRRTRQTAATSIAGPARKIRCGVYTRKSTDEGLDMDFNSLDAQRESCGAYITSQRAEGWLLVADRYDDGGFTGGNM